MLKKLRRYLFTILIIFFFSGLQCFAEIRGGEWWDIWNDFPYETNPYLNPNNDGNEDYIDLWDNVDIKESNSIINRLLWVFWLKNIEWDHKFIAYVRGILNIALWLLSMIALIMTIYTFYMMFFSENEAGAKKAKWNLVGIFIALGIIWLAWLIVSFIFWWYQANWKQHENIRLKQWCM